VDDKTVLEWINELANEEHELFALEAKDGASQEEIERLKTVTVTLDRCWDLLRQRRARRAAGLDPDEARVRDERTVEGYLN
jgi:hypothetical protein